MNIIRRLRASAAIVLMQLELYGRLTGIEWQREKNRLRQLVVFGMVGLIFLSCCLLFLGVLAMVVAWPSPYRIHTVVGVVVVYGVGALWCFLRCINFANSESGAFAATRAEIQKDVALIKSRL